MRTRGGSTLHWPTLVLCPGMVEDWEATPGLSAAYRDGWAVTARHGRTTSRGAVATVGDMPSRRRAAARTAIAVLAAALLSVPAPAAARHETPPARTITYDVQQRGSVQADLETFAAHAAATFADVRGWSLGGSLAYERVARDADLTLWLASPSQMESFSTLCSPRYSCRVGRNVIINDERWRTATPSWTRGLDEYQHYVVNHELGHWLGEGHVDCPGRGQPAPVMQQQSISLQGCVATTWPLAQERASVAQRQGVEVRPDLFRDIAGSVHAPAIRAAADAGVVAGFTDGTYRPAATVTRGQIASVLARARGLQPTGESDFPDIDDSVHATAIRAVADAGIATGYEDGTFGPRDPVTRGQTASFLARALDLDTSDESCAPPDSAASVHAGAICAVLRAGVAEGRADGGFDPESVVDRGQTASFVARAEGLV